MKEKVQNDTFIKRVKKGILKLLKKLISNRFIQKIYNLILTKVLRTRISRNIQAYTTLKEIPILKYWEIAETSNIFLLDKNFIETNVYKNKEIEYFKALWTKLYDDFYSASDNGEQKMALQNSIDLLKLEFQYMTLIDCFNFYAYLSEFEGMVGTEVFNEWENRLLKQFKDLGFGKRISKFNKTDDNLETIKKYIEAVGNKVLLAQEENKTSDKKIVSNIYETVSVVEQTLGRSVGDLEKISVLQWLAYVKMANNLNKKARNG